jgi:molecular chaperone DnaK
MSKANAVGIDLGTTYSVVARLDETGKSQIVRNFHGDILTPSVVLFDDKEIIVGKDAKKASADEVDRVAECVKRDMGSEFYSKPIRGEKLPPEVIQACILRKLAADAVRVCGPDIKVVITVPAYFDEPRRKATADAGEMAGLDVLDIVNEPTAAALSFGEHLGYLDPQGSPKGELKVLVYDLGGGTFDVTIIDLKPGHLRTLATDGDVRLGGRDWDQRMADYLAEKFLTQHGKDPRSEPAGLTRLMRAVEDAKQTLTARISSNVHLDFAGKSVDLTISRETFEELTEDLLERTAYTVRQVMQAAGTSWQYISHILLVGGSTRMPMVTKMLERLSGGMKPEHNVNADEAVARGAAVYAGYLLATRTPADDLVPSSAFHIAGAKFTVTDVNAHSLGIEGVDQQTERKENVILIPRNTPLPFKVQEKFVTRKAGQRSVAVQVLEGESKSPEQCTRIARASLKNLPEGLPQGYPIEVSYEYGSNGRLMVKAKLPGTTKETKIELERERSMNDDRVARWKQVVSQEKGFDSFENLLEEVLQVEGGDEGGPKQPVSRPVPQPYRSEASAPLAAGGATAVAEPKPTAAAPPSLATAAASAAQSALKSAPPEVAAKPLPTFAPSPARRGRSTTSMVVNIIGHLTASILGLTIGYYILCWIEPTANFLELNLPGLRAPTAPQPTPTPTAPTPPQSDDTSS